MVEIKQRFVSKAVEARVTSGGINQRKTLTVHQTGNTSRGANAEMHARLQENGNSRSASWHIQSDDKEIIQSFPFTAQTWHAGDGKGDGNRHSISWEICINSDGNYLKSLELASEGIAQVLKQEGLTVADLRQHYDWSRKNCPAQIRAGKDGVGWSRFKEMVQAHMAGKPVATPVSKPKPKPKAQPQTKSVEQLAQEVIDGKHGTGDARKKALGSQYSAVQKRVNEILAPKAKPTPTRKSNAAIAQEVIDGKWGNNPQRKQKLEKAGYNYSAIQAEVNKRAGVKEKPKKSIDQMAREIVAGKHGNGHSNRRMALGISDAEYQKVRKRVNQLA